MNIPDPNKPAVPAFREWSRSLRWQRAHCTLDIPIKVSPARYQLLVENLGSYEGQMDFDAGPPITFRGIPIEVEA